MQLRNLDANFGTFNPFEIYFNQPKSIQPRGYTSDSTINNNNGDTLNNGKFRIEKESSKIFHVQRVLSQNSIDNDVASIDSDSITENLDKLEHARFSFETKSFWSMNGELNERILDVPSTVFIPFNDESTIFMKHAFWSLYQPTFGIKLQNIRNLVKLTQNGTKLYDLNLNDSDLEIYFDLMNIGWNDIFRSLLSQFLYHFVKINYCWHSVMAMDIIPTKSQINTLILSNLDKRDEDIHKEFLHFYSDIYLIYFNHLSNYLRQEYSKYILISMNDNENSIESLVFRLYSHLQETGLIDINDELDSIKHWWQDLTSYSKVSYDPNYYVPDLPRHYHMAISITGLTRELFYVLPTIASNMVHGWHGYSDYDESKTGELLTIDVFIRITDLNDCKLFLQTSNKQQNSKYKFKSRYDSNELNIAQIVRLFRTSNARLVSFVCVPSDLEVNNIENNNKGLYEKLQYFNGVGAFGRWPFPSDQSVLRQFIDLSLVYDDIKQMEHKFLKYNYDVLVRTRSDGIFYKPFASIMSHIDSVRADLQDIQEKTRIKMYGGKDRELGVLIGENGNNEKQLQIVAIWKHMMDDLYFKIVVIGCNGYGGINDRFSIQSRYISQPIYMRIDYILSRKYQWHVWTAEPFFQSVLGYEGIDTVSALKDEIPFVLIGSLSPQTDQEIGPRSLLLSPHDSLSSGYSAQFHNKVSWRLFGDSQFCVRYAGHDKDKCSDQSDELYWSFVQKFFNQDCVKQKSNDYVV